MRMHILARTALILTPLAAILLAGCSGGGSTGERSAQAAAKAATEDHTPTLLTWMTGSFSSATQSTEDKEFRDIRLHITPIWTARADGPWLYVEQAAATALDRPYRQRVYRLSRTTDGRYRSEVFEFAGDPLIHAGAWREPARLDRLSPDDLKLKDGCHVLLTFQPSAGKSGPAFVGATEGKGCPSALANAAYATSEVTITDAGLKTLDRGYDAAGKQVWGSTKGAYRFDRVNP